MLITAKINEGAYLITSIQKLSLFISILESAWTPLCGFTCDI